MLSIYDDGERLRFGCDLELIPNTLAGMAVEELRKFPTTAPPAPGAVLKRVAEVQIVRVNDTACYGIDKGEPVGKPDVGRKPSAASGAAVVQSLVFDRDVFSLEDAKAWISSHDGFGDYGVDETENTYRFRQYDPQWFSAFRTGELREGLVAIYGIVKDAELASDEAGGNVAKAVNARLARDGLRLVLGSARVEKAEGTDGTEERYVLGIVLEPTDGEGGAEFKPDTQGDIYSVADVRRAAHAWMEQHGKVDLDHSWDPTSKQQVRVLETYLAPVDMEINGETIAKGTWLLALRVLDDTIWATIKAGGIGAYSIGGTAMREPVSSEDTNG
jgi:hypothetical protein